MADRGQPATLGAPKAPADLADLGERLERDLAVQGTDGQPSPPERMTPALPETVTENGEQDGHANRRPDPARTATR